MQPVRAFRDVETADGDQKSGNDRGRVHPAPGIEVGHDHQHCIADRGASQGAHGLERKRAQHQFAPAGARDVLGNDHVRRWIIATERDPEPEQADHQGDKVGAEHGSAEKRGEDDHLHDEHGLAAEPIRQAAQADSADQDSAQARGADEAVLREA